MSSHHPVEFRPALTEDADTIRDVVCAAYARWIPVIGREPRPMNADYEQAVREHQIDLMSIDAQVVGLIETMLREDHLWIENIAVRPDAQGQGLGRLLLAHAEHRAVEAGRDEIRLLTNAAFEANVALYKKTGYRIVHREPFMGGTTVYMNKTLGR
ncbi:GNAT family N-acetyltransferase [Microvirga sp. 2MCAF35]|uniref:GNAT family N-acetyltransferase n=1 Tax=Microvirga sp. 2MCAF35 TaxID=3232987 RepID=UPI003F99E2ED